MQVIVTGGNGQLGNSLRGFMEQTPGIVPRFIDIEELDLTDEEATENFFSSNRCDFLINCAAYTAVDKAEQQPDLAEAVNIKATVNMGKAATRHGFKMIHISTDYVFDGSKASPYRETDLPNPKTVYGETKLKGERLLRTLTTDTIIIRTSWLYSLYGKNFFLTMRQKALSGDAVNVVADQVGTPTYAGDLAKAILEIISSTNWVPGIYNFSNEGSTTWYDFTKTIYEMLEADPNLVTPVTSDQYKTLAVRPKYSVLDKTKIKNTYKLDIPNWKESLQKVVELSKQANNGNK